jgi:hypothetical protein
MARALNGTSRLLAGIAGVAGSPAEHLRRGASRLHERFSAKKWRCAASQVGAVSLTRPLTRGFFAPKGSQRTRMSALPVRSAYSSHRYIAAAPSCGFLTEH